MKDKLKVPAHIAIIMDGSGRWARARHLPKIMGHKKGAEVIREVTRISAEMGVKVLTLYAFSTENWKRPKNELNGLMNLLRNYLKKEKEELNKNGIRFMSIGRLKQLPADIQEGIRELMNETRDNAKLILNLAINYGSRCEIIDAATAIAEKIRDGTLSSESITEGLFSNYLYTKDLPDPDLIIRTSGEMRLSNFLLWQASYSEIYVTKKFWPDFTKDDLVKAVKDYSERDRRFGG